jgi:glucokinase
MILAGDIGGTHTRLALCDGNSHEPPALTIYPSRKHAGFEEHAGLFGAARIARREPPHIRRAEA